jgi:hypothetical protein
MYAYPMMIRIIVIMNYSRNNTTILPLALSEISNKLNVSEDLIQRVLRELILNQRIVFSEQKFKLND